MQRLDTTHLLEKETIDEHVWIAGWLMVVLHSHRTTSISHTHTLLPLLWQGR